MKKIAASALALTIALGMGVAQANEGHMDEKFEKVDTNSDGMISKSEWDAKGAELFNKMDKNNDGNISKAEGESFKDEMKDKWKDKKHDMSDHDDKGNDHKGVTDKAVER